MSRRTKADKRFRALLRKASDAYQRGEKRLAADGFLGAFKAAPWDGRASCLACWMDCTIQDAEGSCGAKLDLKDAASKMKGISKDETEPAHLRFIALLFCSGIQHAYANYTKEATFLRRALAFASCIDEQESLKTMMLFDAATGDMYKRERIGDYVAEVVDTAMANLIRIERPQTFPIDIESFVDGIAKDSDLDSDLGREESALALRVCFSTAGRTCDYCNKTATEAGLPVLHKCSRCRISFYCSKACQAMQWQKGHKSSCRKYGEVDGAAVMLIHSLNNRKDLNGKAAIIRGPALGKVGRWEVEIHGARGVLLSVASENLRHLRPRDSLFAQAATY